GDRTAYPVGAPETRYDAVYWNRPVLAGTRRNRVLVGQYPASAIGAIDLTTGAASIAVDATSPGPGRLIAASFMPDRQNDRALVLDHARDVQMLDLQTGERVLLLRSSW